MSESLTVNPRGMVRHILKNYAPHELEDALTELIGDLRFPAAPPPPMHVDAILRQLGGLRADADLTLHTSLLVTPLDAAATATITFVMQRLATDATIGDTETVLQHALFWLQLFSRARAVTPAPAQEEPHAT